MDYKNFFKDCCAVLFLMLLLSVACYADPNTEFDEEGNPLPPTSSAKIVSGNPALIDIIITSKDEIVVTVDPEAGEDTAVYSFDAYIIPKNMRPILMATYS